MPEEKKPEESSLVPVPNTNDDIQRFEAALLNYMGGLGLPTDSVFAPVPQRLVVFQNTNTVIDGIDSNIRSHSVYISKFLAAVAAGLFDAALNYLWDQTIFELRHRVAQYDLDYFFDIVVKDPKKRSKLSDEDDLTRIDDSDLIHGAREIELISEMGYKHLDFIRYMRNWASAAHPNQNEITGLQLISWLETCIREVINLPLSNVVVEIKQLLGNIKTNRISGDDARQIAIFFTNLTQDRVNTLCSGFFGIYTQIDTSTQTRQNIQHLLPHLWDRVSETARNELGVKYAQFLARNEQQQQQLARQFLEIVSGLSYMPEDVLAAEIDSAVDNLLGAHRGINNFYNEPAFARQLHRVVGGAGKIPESVTHVYVLGVVEAFLTNGNGVAWNAEPTYIELLQQFDPRQSLIAAVSFRSTTIASKLQFTLCQRKYDEMLKMMAKQVANPAVKELIEEVQDALAKETSPERLRQDRRLADKIDNLRKILNV
jgi:hypothetical protein